MSLPHTFLNARGMPAAGGGGLAPVFTYSASYLPSPLSTSISSLTTWNYTFTNVPSVTTAGKRYIIVVTGNRDWNGNSYNTYSQQFLTTSSGSIVVNDGSGNTMSMTKANNSSLIEGHSAYNATVISGGFVDAAGNITVTFNRAAGQVSGGGDQYISIFVFDDITTISYIANNIVNSNTSGDNSQTLNVTANNSTNASAVFRVVGGNSSNSGNAFPVYMKATSEPAYTKLFDGMNGTSENFGVYYYWNGTHGTQVNLDGQITLTTSASNGLAGAAAIFGFE